MARDRHPRWTDAAFGRFDVSESGNYPGDVQGPVQRAELRSPDGMLLGHVWTDGFLAAGFMDDDAAGVAGVRAGARVWRILADAYAAGRPASDVLDPALYEPEFQLIPPQ